MKTTELATKVQMEICNLIANEVSDILNSIDSIEDDKEREEVLSDKDLLVATISGCVRNTRKWIKYAKQELVNDDWLEERVERKLAWLGY